MTLCTMFKPVIHMLHHCAVPNTCAANDRTSCTVMLSALLG